MRRNMCKSKMPVDYPVFLGKEPVMVEITPAPEKEYLTIFGERMMRLLGITLQKKTETVYRIYGKYRVKETFAGEESLTSLLTQYVERTVSMRC